MAVQHQGRVLEHHVVSRQGIGLQSTIELMDRLDEAATPTACQYTIQMRGGTVVGKSRDEVDAGLAALSGDDCDLYSASIALTVPTTGNATTKLTINMNALSGVVTFNSNNTAQETWGEAARAFYAAFRACVESALEPLGPDRDLQQHVADLQSASSQLFSTMDKVEALLERAQTVAKDAAEAAVKAGEFKELTAKAHQASKIAANASTAANSEMEATRQARKESEELRVKSQAIFDSLGTFEKRMKQAQGDADESIERLKEEAERAKAGLTSEAESTMKDVAEKASSSRAAMEDAHNTAMQRVQGLSEEAERVLQRAIAGELYEVFRKTQEARQTQAYWYLAGVVGSALLAGVAPAIVVGLSGGTDSLAFDAFTLIRVLTALPVLLLGAFFVREYAAASRLVRMYEFKSAVALSLTAYESMLSSDDRDEVVQSFLVDAIKEIYRSTEPPERAEPRTVRQFRRVLELVKETGVIDVTRQAAGLPISERRGEADEPNTR